MKLPPNYTEEQVLEVFNKVIKKLSFKFRFGINSEEDIAQQAMIFAIDSLERYDSTRPLANFVYIHVKNRLYNYKRDNYFRLEKPCSNCPVGAFLPPDGCSAFKDRQDCSLFAGWVNRKTVKKNLTNSLEYNQVNSAEKNMGYDSDQAGDINSKEIKELIDNELPISLRKYYLMMLAGDKVPKKERLLVEEAVLDIIKRNNYEI